MAIAMNLGRMLIFAGLVFVACGLLVTITHKLNLPIGRLPGDVTWRGRNTTVYFPWVTCLVISVVGTLLLWLFNRR